MLQLAVFMKHSYIYIHQSLLTLLDTRQIWKHWLLPPPPLSFTRRFNYFDQRETRNEKRETRNRTGPRTSKQTGVVADSEF